jgi:hypothetical protein
MKFVPTLVEHGWDEIRENVDSKKLAIITTPSNP